MSFYIVAVVVEDDPALTLGQFLAIFSQFGECVFVLSRDRWSRQEDQRADEQEGKDWQDRT